MFARSGHGAWELGHSLGSKLYFIEDTSQGVVQRSAVASSTRCITQFCIILVLFVGLNVAEHCRCPPPETIIWLGGSRGLSLVGWRWT